MKIVLFAVVVLSGLGMIAYWLQDHFIFFPEKIRQSYAFRFPAAFTERFIHAADGGVVNVLVFEGSGNQDLVYYHGNAGSLRTWGVVASVYAAMGFEVWVMDYRGYGKSKGVRTEAFMNEDALRVYDEAAKGGDRRPIIVYGRSLGGAFASYVGSRREPDKVVLEAPFYRLSDVAQMHLPLLPARLLLRYRFPVHEYVSEITCPVMVVHGTDDKVVPLASAEKLRPFLKSSDRFVVIEGGGHNNLAEFDTFGNAVVEFLQAPASH